MEESNPPDRPANLDEERSPITAWHHLLVQTMERLIGPELLTIHPFFRLGELPLEADVIALLRHLSAEELAARVPEFDFILRHMAPLTVLEYKGPDDRLTLAGFTTALAYAFLARRKLKDNDRLRPLREMALQVLYSHKEKGLLETLAADGFVFEEIEAGVLRCGALRMPIYLMDLVVLSDQDPERLINLLSARHRRYRPPVGPRQAAAINLYYNVFQELRRMLSNEKLKDLPGAREVVEDTDEILRRLAAQMPLELRLHGLSPEERLRGLGPEERLRGLDPEERLRGLGPEERLRGLGPEELERLRALLNRSKS